MLGHFFERKQHGFSKRKIEVLIIGNWLKTRGHYLYSNEKKIYTKPLSKLQKKIILNWVIRSVQECFV